MEPAPVLNYSIFEVTVSRVVSPVLKRGAIRLAMRKAWRKVMSWRCPRCDRAFRRVNQRHACGVGSAASLVRGRPAALADLYRHLETTVRTFGDVEIVARDRYALFRTTRIFADLTVTRDALRIVIHLARIVKMPHFVKIGKEGKRVSHVAFVRTAQDLLQIVPFRREAHDLAASEESHFKGSEGGRRKAGNR